MHIGVWGPLLVALFSLGTAKPASAGEPYALVGVGQSHNVYEDMEQIHGPFGRVELGYRWRSVGEIDINLLHISSISSRTDRGTNFIGISYRFTGNDARWLFARAFSNTRHASSDDREERLPAAVVRQAAQTEAEVQALQQEAILPAALSHRNVSQASSPTATNPRKSESAATGGPSAGGRVENVRVALPVPLPPPGLD